MRLACAALLAAGVAWGAGFAWFSVVARQKGRAPAAADGIVALTGGADRIEMAVRLLQDGVAPVLLISGVAGGADLGGLIPHMAGDRAALAPRITLGRAATSTIGNAAETVAWARARNLRRLVVVTAGYHMPRALLEIGHAMPEAELIPMPVPRTAVKLRVLASEFDKLLAVRLGLTGLWVGLGRTEDGT